MKYIITDKGEVRKGGGYHHDLAADTDGIVVAAGHCEQQPDGSYKVWGQSFGYGIKARPEDAELLRGGEDNATSR